MLFRSVNNTSVSPLSFRMNARENYLRMLDLCVRYQVPIVVDSDSHVDVLVGSQEYALEMLDEMGFPEELIMNTKGDAIYDYINYSPK